MHHSAGTKALCSVPRMLHKFAHMSRILMVLVTSFQFEQRTQHCSAVKKGCKLSILTFFPLLNVYSSVKV